MSEWREMTLREAGVSLIDCDHRTPPPATGGYPYVAIPQLKQGRLDLSDARRITREHFVEWTRKANPQPNDVVLSRRCNPGESAFVPHGLEFALGQNLVLLRADESKMFPPFLRWLVRGGKWWEQIDKFINVGAIFTSLRCADIPNFQLPIPPLPEQRAIASVLGALDDKIELNRRMNETLEALAQSLFKSWFVDATQSALPKGWKLTRLKDLTTKIGSGATPRGGSAVYVEEGVALIRSQNVYDHEFHWDGLARLTDEAAKELQSVEVKPDDILLNITGDSILRTCVVDPDVLPARVNQHVLIIRAAPGIPPRFLHLFLVRPRTKYFLEGLNAGATRQAVTKAQLELLEVLNPPKEVLDQFAATTEPLFKRIESNRSESRTLAALRDALLPKLLSGELRVAKLQN